MKPESLGHYSQDQSNHEDRYASADAQGPDHGNEQHDIRATRWANGQVLGAEDNSVEQEPQAIGIKEDG